MEIVYGREKQLYAVRAKSVILGCWNMMIPYLCPELPAKQKEALHYGVKVPLVYTAVALRNWTAFKKLGMRGAQTPGMYHSTMNLEQPTDIGDYRPAMSPDQPAIVRMLRTPCKPGLSARDQQRAGHADLLSTPFSTFERNIRDQFARVLGAWRVRSGARYRSHHGESMAARLRVRIQFLVGSGMAEGRSRPARSDENVSGAFRSRIRTRPPRLIPTKRSIRLIAPCKNNSADYFGRCSLTLFRSEGFSTGLFAAGNPFTCKRYARMSIVSLGARLPGLSGGMLLMIRP